MFEMVTGVTPPLLSPRKYVIVEQTIYPLSV
ncbi:hypothetical protein SAMN00017405_2405 [Desulfonispora thiosulfatigenes DSM 11270]|uniref:Uncharacterized protein n=1 Tax=Desulfonispora thiosulfatigenes DSM 11270 TaxID=656914 RepID=A0A1W1VDX1_DESTI|nr:hypothetical protein SAMN00017405_2382 [Desulfonispora thiosulfatigenes DSM 11270]SMB91516.1 hypothetical protein SAMN00017405_2195 [Desulfonispora thiosulfatigenes DSM 11270]SMB96705.1 hypothetical protein SAMN00017405_2403 [Desulfonispora thiosulfatigenes DSM 11270]SMB96719.1 hypothetical protein SAMN00017405_2405 [Desulfonispora thiosulfatigenes DSM 11270]